VYTDKKFDSTNNHAIKQAPDMPHEGLNRRKLKQTKALKIESRKSSIVIATIKMEKKKRKHGIEYK